MSEDTKLLIKHLVFILKNPLIFYLSILSFFGSERSPRSPDVVCVCVCQSVIPHYALKLFKALQLQESCKRASREL